MRFLSLGVVFGFLGCGMDNGSLGGCVGFCRRFLFGES